MIPADLDQDCYPCAGLVRSHSGTGAWLYPENDGETFPAVSELLLIQFQGESVFTHEVSVLNKKGAEILVSVPRNTKKEKSILAPSTGRYDYRIDVSIPVRVKTQWIEPKDAPPKLATLTNLSRGGMSMVAPISQEYNVGQEITIRVVGWDRKIRVEAVVKRISKVPQQSKNEIALTFPIDMDVLQRESISSFIIQVQRREALSRDLPSPEDEA